MPYHTSEGGKAGQTKEGKRRKTKKKTQNKTQYRTTAIGENLDNQRKESQT